MLIRSITIDLDGTLADTVLDLAAACNAMLADLGRAPHAVEDIRDFVGMGMRVLVERCLDGQGRTDPALLEAGVAAFRRRYAEVNGRYARLYPGAAEGVAAMLAAGFRLGCVTNKPAEFTEPLLVRLGLGESFAVVVSGDTLPYKKPRPEPILHACAVMGTEPGANIHIGDSVHDVEAAHAAGSGALVVPYGYAGSVDIGAHARLVSDLAGAAEFVARLNSVESTA